MANKKVPELRFKGFTEDWELCKLRGKVTIRSGWSPSNFVRTMSEDSELFIKVDDLNYSLREQKDSQMRVQDNPRFNKMKKGSTIFPKRGAAIMTNKVRILGSDGYMDTNMMALEPQEIDPNFLYTFIARTGLYKIADTSTIPQINNKHIEPYVIYCPNNEEQEKVGLLFKKLDDAITLHQRKLEQIQLLKLAYLHQMFPSDTEKVPKLRFANFSDQWEQRKFAKVLKTHSFRPYLVKSDEDGKYEVIQQGDKPVVGYANGEPFQAFEDVTLFGDHTVSLYKPSTPFFISTDGVKILSAERFDGTYLFATLERYKPESQGYKRHFSILKNEDVKYTENSDEQIKIGKFFSQLDKSITLHQQKLELLKILKQAYLQKMFI